MKYRSVTNIALKRNIVGIIYGFLIFLLCMPYFMWQSGIYIKLFIMVIIAIISLTFPEKFKIADFIILLFFLVIFLYNSNHLNIFGMISSRILILAFFIISKDIILLSLDWFKKIFTISLLLSLITFILLVVFSIPINYNVISPLNEFKSISYNQYPLLISSSELGINYFNIRFCGMFDEPGVVGTIASILLIIDNFNLKSKQNVVLLIAGILSFSLFFFIISLAYLLFFLKNKMRLFLVLIILALFLLIKDNLIFNYLILDRIKIENGILIGYDRTTIGLDNLWTNFLNSNDIFWGKGYNYLWERNEVGSSSYKELIITNGFVFFIVFCLSFFFFAYSVIKKPKLIAIYLLLFFSVIFQRPFIYNPSYIFLLVSSIFAIKQLGINEDIKRIRISK